MICSNIYYMRNVFSLIKWWRSLTNDDVYALSVHVENEQISSRKKQFIKEKNAKPSYSQYAKLTKEFVKINYIRLIKLFNCKNNNLIKQENKFDKLWCCQKLMCIHLVNIVKLQFIIVLKIFLKFMQKLLIYIITIKKVYNFFLKNH